MTPKTKKILLYSIPILAGVFFIFKGLRTKAQDPFKGELKKDVGKTIPVEVKKQIIKADDCTYPIKKGDGSVSNPCKQVMEIQAVLNSFPQDFPYKPLVVDGDFGTKTETALQTIYGKKQIDNDADLNNLYLRQKDSILSDILTPFEFNNKWYVRRNSIMIEVNKPVTTSIFSNIFG